MAHVLPQQFPQGGEFLVLQPGLIVVLVALERLTGVQRQKFYRFHTPQQFRQGADTAPDPLGGQNPHELPGGQMPPQLFFLFSIQDLLSLHS